MSITIPSAVKAEHDELHAALAEATRAGGRTGEAAKAVAKLMHPHFVAEEAFALPPLGLLAPPAGDLADEDASAAIAMAERLRSELPRMLAEHRAIVAALGSLATAATDENLPDVARFARALVQHAMLEEQVMYPAALLVGEHLQRMRPSQPARGAPDVAPFDLVAELDALRAGASPAAGRHFAKTLTRSSSLRLVLVALDAGARIAEHRAEGMIAIHVIDGCVRLRSGASTTELKAGALATVEHEVEHALEAVERSGVLLSIAWTGHHTAR